MDGDGNGGKKQKKKRRLPLRGGTDGPVASASRLTLISEVELHSIQFTTSHGNTEHGQRCFFLSFFTSSLVSLSLPLSVIFRVALTGRPSKKSCHSLFVLYLDGVGSEGTKKHQSIIYQVVTG